MKNGKLTSSQIDKLRATGKDYELRDHIVTDLYIRVKYNGTKSWAVKYTDPESGDKRRYYTLQGVPCDGKSLDLAREEARRFLGELLRTRKSPKTVKRELQAKKAQEQRKAMTLGDLLPMYETYIGHLKAKDFRMLDLRKVAESCIGKKPISKLTSKDMLKFIEEERDKGNTYRTINKKITELYGMVNLLYKKGEISPDDIKLPSKPEKLSETDSKRNRRYFEPWERQALVEKSSQIAEYPWLHTAVIISLNTGVRPNSLFHLKWSDIDFTAHTIRLAAEYMKTKDEWSIPCNTPAEQVLSDWRRVQPSNDGFVFHRSDGKLVGLDDWATAFEKLCRLCGIKNATWYNMRHDFASQLVMLGVPLITVRDLMCHKDIRTTQIYAHLAPDLKTAAVKQLAMLQEQWNNTNE
ncbi:MAG TPA: site-specific integrase [Candidatus Caccocola faecipullorum]|nr:site-specific integrase [Candidatus Caccocola faecipullorum]